MIINKMFQNTINFLTLSTKIIFIISFTLVSITEAAVPKNDVFNIEYLKAKNTSLQMQDRWQALMNATNHATGDDFIKITEFIQSSDWYMRNASLIALDKSGNDVVYEQAKKLITDRALVVRSAAAEILSRLNNDDIKKIFSVELDKNYNFKGKNSLWIRNQMMNYLVKHAETTEKDFFVKYLNDQDIEIANLSTQALEKITDIRFSGTDKKDIVRQWQKLAKNQKW